MENKHVANPFIDHFSDDLSPGRVIGSRSAAGTQRRGVDVEGVISIDNQALRIQPLLQPGWGRAGIAYGPYRRENGLAFGVYLLNGHHSSQTGDLTQRLVDRLYRWARGSEAEKLPQRLFRWVLVGNKRRFLRQLRRWTVINKQYRRGGAGSGATAAIDENLALGWFPHETPADPPGEGHGFIVHAAGPENGALWIRSGAALLPAINGLQNIPLYLLVVLREQGAAYYAASLPDAHGLAALPNLRPLAIDPFNDDPTLFAILHQSVLGQIGFRVDTRVYQTQVGRISDLNTWYGTAHAADRLTGLTSLAQSKAEIGGMWTVYEGEFERTTLGIKPIGRENLAVLDPGQPTGLVHVLIDQPNGRQMVGLVWRFQDAANYWRLFIQGDLCRLDRREAGEWKEVATNAIHSVESAPRSLQLLDDGKLFNAYLNGRPLFDADFNDTRLATATGVGVYATANQEIKNEEMHMLAFEAHPRLIPIPPTFAPDRNWLPAAEKVTVSDDFAQDVGDLDGRVTSVGNKPWRRELGTGVIELNGNQTAQVRASVQAPNPGRTAYTVPWDNPTFADLRVSLIPPGMGRGLSEKGRGGLIFWQDPHNYIIVNTWLDDYYGGAAVSAFFHLHGFEELYDAVWSNVGRRIYWGTPYELRVAFDGLTFTAFVDDEPVLYRALTDVYPQFKQLAIKRVGIIANWDWGNDTGTHFRYFAAAC